MLIKINNYLFIGFEESKFCTLQLKAAEKPKVNYSQVFNIFIAQISSNTLFNEVIGVPFAKINLVERCVIVK